MSGPQQQGATGSTLRLRSVRDLDQLRSEWSDLAELGGNVFSTWEWADVWWRHFGANRPLSVTGCYDDERLVAILPLYQARRRPLTVLRFLGHGPADELGPVCAPADRAAALDALRKGLESGFWDADMLIADCLREDSEWTPPRGTRLISRHASPVVRIDGASWEEYFASRRRKFRGEVGRRDRKLDRERVVRLEVCDDAERFPAALDALFDLHRQRWNGASTSFTRDEFFQREFAAVSLRRGWARLTFLEVDGERAAVVYGHRFAGAESSYQVGRRQEARKAYALGTVLLLRCLRSAVADGMTEYRLLKGDESYKYDFADDDRPVLNLAVAATARGRVGAVTLTAFIEARRRARILVRAIRRRVRR